MADYAGMENEFAGTLGLSRRPVAVAYLDNGPAGVPAFSGTAPAGCTFWRLAAERGPFYTAPADHYNCPIGSYTHNISPPAARAQELTDTLGLMSSLGYVRMEDVPSIARLDQAPKVVLYAPLAQTPVTPDAVIFTGKPAGMMLLVEAAQRANAYSSLPFLSRPTCMAIPAAMKSGTVVSGCIGNRVYTGIGPEEFYAVVPGAALGGVAEALRVIRAANAQLEKYHTARRAAGALP